MFKIYTFLTIVFSILFNRINDINAVCITRNPITTIAPGMMTTTEAQTCVWYQNRGLFNGQNNLFQLTDSQVNNSPSIAENMYDCCNICIKNDQYCNVFVFDQTSRNCIQYSLNIKNAGSLNPYIIFNPNSVIGGVVSYLSSN